MCWNDFGGTIQVLTQFRDGGATIATHGKMHSDTLQAGVVDTTTQVTKLHRVPISKREQATAIRTRSLPKALYGCEVASVAPATLKALQTAFLRVLSKKGTTGTPGLAFPPVRGDQTLTLLLQSCFED